MKSLTVLSQDDKVKEFKQNDREVLLINKVYTKGSEQLE